ncbi:MAG: molybdopterin-synthase adenylyltransferase MoeB [Peptococcaceae bacterium]|nr:MAG: molybdopterin-synthase adenylyltransferase MoeB [Peptococcaceae bacterium]
MPEVGEEGQKKISEARVFLVGAGGLGSPAGYYLAAAGVGQIGIIDNDVVELSNLQRQILHNTSRLGEAKVESARQTLENLNPEISVITYRERLTAENVYKLIKNYDLIVDCSDNYDTRYVSNDACVHTGKPLIYGAVFRFEGQAMTIIPGAGPCYRCLYPAPPPPGIVLSPREAGLFGVLPGLIGLIQATEALKLILGQGELLTGRLLSYNALTMEFAKLKVQKNSRCPACSKVVGVR